MGFFGNLSGLGAFIGGGLADCACGYIVTFLPLNIFLWFVCGCGYLVFSL